MSVIGNQHGAPSKSRLPSPGCLFAVTVLVIVTSLAGWIGWRGHRLSARLEYFDQLGAVVETEPGRPAWLHDFVLSTLGEEAAAGFTDVTRLSLSQTRLTETGLHCVEELPYLQFLDLPGLHVSRSTS